MRNNTFLCFVATSLAAVGPSLAADLGTAFTYQGSLEKPAGSPVTDTCDFRFGLWKAPTSVLPADKVGPTLTFDGVGGNPPPVAVSAGLFTVPLDFGSNAINGTARWLEIEVRCPTGVGGFSLLVPRVELTPAPHALSLPGLYTQQNATSPNLIGGYPGNTVTAGVVGATIGGGGVDFLINSVSGGYGTVAGGLGNTGSGGSSTVGGGGGNSATGNGATIGGGTGNLASGLSSTIAGGESNTANGVFHTTVGGGFGNTASDSFSTVGGGLYNEARGNNSTIAGGGGSPFDLASGNKVYDSGGTIGGGSRNRAGSDDGNDAGSAATVAGGIANAASASGSTVGGGSSNAASASGSTVGGGSSNAASAFGSTVASGDGNAASGDYSTIGGGAGNNANGESSTIPGGIANRAGGDYSLAAGLGAVVRDAAASGDADGDEGTFAWGDSTAAYFVSTGANQFLVRASGGIYLGANSKVDIPVGRFINTSTGGYLTTGGVWTDSSDRDMKENFEPLNGRAVLDQLADVPITRWNFKVQKASVRHIGPTAQDFHAAFGTGEDDRHIAALDTTGVALAAIQGLYEVVQDRECQINELREQNDREMAELRSEISDLKAMVDTLAAQSAGGGR